QLLAARLARLHGELDGLPRALRPSRRGALAPAADHEGTAARAHPESRQRPRDRGHSPWPAERRGPPDPRARVLPGLLPGAERLLAEASLAPALDLAVRPHGEEARQDTAVPRLRGM